MALRVAIIDDSLLVRSNVRKLLEQHTGCTVCGEAGDGATAIHVVEQLHPDLVLMDVNMPELNGLEATRVIRRRYPSVRILVMTIYADGRMTEAAREAGAHGCIAKVELVQMLDAAVENIQALGSFFPF